MKILRLGTSNDVQSRIPRESLSHAIVERRLTEITGEPVETVVRTVWPTQQLPGIVERWMSSYQPDLVYLKVPAYWFNYESVPLRIKRRFGRIGKSVASAGLTMADTPWIAHTRIFHAGRHLAVRAIGGDTNFTPDEVIERMSACIRIVVRSEGTGLVVEGPVGETDYSHSRRGRDRAEARRLRVHHAISALCRELHVDHMGSEMPQYARPDRTTRLGDRIHWDAAAHEAIAGEEVDYLLRAWERLHEIPARTGPRFQR